MKKSEIIDKLVEFGAGTEEELNDMLKGDLEVMLDKFEAEDVVEDEVVEEEAPAEEEDEVTEDEVVEEEEAVEEIDFSKLSKAQIREYQRTGKI